MITAFHCTRLTERDIQDIHKNGLVPLAPNHPEKRIRREAEAGSFSIEIRDKLLGEQKEFSGHEKLIFFIRNEGGLKHSGDVALLLSFWGGEAIAWNHTEDPKMEWILRNIGTPCIIEVVLNEHDLEDVPGDIRTKKPVPPNQIVDIHLLGDASFEQLTSCQNWRMFDPENPVFGWN